MKRSIPAFFLVFSLAATPLTTLAVGESVLEADTRYFMASTKAFWQNSLGVRHAFEDGFTADLSDFQLRLAKLAGLKPIPVKRLTILPNEGSTAIETDGKLPSTSVPWGVSMLVGTAPVGGVSVSVAVLDTGIDGTHPDLVRRIATCTDVTGLKPVMNSGSCGDENGHGTHVAGIIAADGGDDGTGIYGIAPKARLHVFKVCNAKGSCWSDDVAAAIRAAADAGTNIINLSLGSDTYSSLVAAAVTYATQKGSLVIAAAGNDGPYTGSIDYPAALTDAVAVGAVDAEQAIPDWSSRGGDEGAIEMAAPGVNIESTFMGGGYAILSGTSMAAPHVAGLAALVWDFETEHPAQAARQTLHEFAVDLLPEGDDEGSGWGLPLFLR